MLALEQERHGSRFQSQSGRSHTIALSIQSLLLVAGAWFLLLAWNRAKTELDRRLDLMQARVEVLTDAVQHMVGTVDRCASQTSLILHQGERLASGVTALVAAPRTLLLAGATSRFFSRWRRKS